MSNNLYVEQRPDRSYAVQKLDAKRASAIAPTQKQAIQLARQIDRDAVILVERVRDTSKGKRDKWRRP